MARVLALESSSLARRRISMRHSVRSEEHTSELQSQSNLVCRLLLEKKKKEYHVDAICLSHVLSTMYTSINNNVSPHTPPPRVHSLTRTRNHHVNIIPRLDAI